MAKSALTFGNVVLYHDSNPSSEAPRVDGLPGLVRYGPHEEGHTYQNQVFGPLFLPFYFMNGGLAHYSQNPFERSADNYAQGRGDYFPWP